MTRSVRLVFLGCGFITGVHAKHLRHLSRSAAIEIGFASRDLARAEDYRSRFGGVAAYEGYDAVLSDPAVDAVVIAVPPNLHLDLLERALSAGKHVLVEKPAFPTSADFATAIGLREQAGKVVLVGENDHYKPLVRTLSRLLAADAVGELVMASFVTVADKPKAATDWRNDEAVAGGDAFFEEGIHWLHVAGALGPRITSITGLRPQPASNLAELGDRRSRSRLIAFDYDNGAVGALLYSREIPSLLRGVRISKLFGREGVITFESNGGAVLVRRRGKLPRLVLPGYADIRGYRAMYEDFVASIRSGRQPEMSLERALDDHRLMEASGA